MILNKFKQYNRMVWIVIAFFLLFGNIFAEINHCPYNKKNIPANADTIIFETKLIPPSGTYSNLVNHLKQDGYRIMAAEEMFDRDLLDKISDKNKLIFTAKKQINDTLAIRMKNEVKSCDSLNCGIIVVSVEYANDAQAPLHQWKEAGWNQPVAQKAISIAIDAIKQAGYDTHSYR